MPAKIVYIDLITRTINQKLIVDMSSSIIVQWTKHCTVVLSQTLYKDVD